MKKLQKRLYYDVVSTTPVLCRHCYTFLAYETEFVLFLVVLKKFCLAHDHELGQLTRHMNSDVRTLNFRSDIIFALL